MSALDEIEAATGEALAAAGPAVVRIGQGPGRGTGFVFDTGLVVTNAHNLRGPTVTVTFADGRQVRGDVAGVDGDGDLVAIRVDTGDVAPLAWAGEGDQPGIGRVVFALSRPFGGGARITSGPVSALDRPFRGPRGRLIEGGIEHTAPLGRGSSGGPLVDRQGHLVAINTHRLGGGFYAAVPANPALRERLGRLSAGEAPTSLRLGVALAPSGAARRLRAAVGLPEREGLLVRGVEEGGPAHNAGVARGDLIVTAAGSPVTSIDGLLAALEHVGDDRSLTLGLVRGVEEITTVVHFEAVPAAD